MADLRIGISGWTYTPWRGVFYPDDLAQKRELEYASRQLNSIEINGSFYSLQKPASYAKWHDETPRDFVFSMKGGRFITHMKKLKDVRVPLANFLASGVFALREKLGPILWQFPPTFGFDETRFREFFEMLPRTTKAAAKLSREHDVRMKGRALTETDRDRPMRYAVEIRHDSFRDERFVKLLREFNIAFVFADTANRWPYFEDITSDFIYCRLHGDEELYVSGYTEAALDHWANRIKQWTSGREPADRVVVSTAKAKRQPRDVFVYFDNDVKVRSPADAMNLSRKLGLKVGSMDASRCATVTETARTSWAPISRKPTKRKKSG